MFHRYVISAIALTATALLSACANQSANHQVAGALIKAVEQTVRAGQSSSQASGNTAMDADYRRGFRSAHETKIANISAGPEL